MSARSTTRRRGNLWPLLGIATLFTYNTWVLWRPMHAHRQIFNGYLSEFSASNQPHNLFFRGGDLTTALIVGTLGVRAVLLWRTRQQTASAPDRPAPGRWWLVAAIALVLFGVATFSDSFSSMDCSPSVSKQCRVLEETGKLSLVHYAHTYTSVGAQIGIVASMVATYIAMLRSARQTRLRRTVVLVICVIEVVALTLMMAMLVLGAPGLGYPQAVMVAMASIWFAAVGVRLGRAVAPVDPAPTPRHAQLVTGGGRNEH